MIKEIFSLWERKWKHSRAGLGLKERYLNLARAKLYLQKCSSRLCKPTLIRQALDLGNTREPERLSMPGRKQVDYCGTKRAILYILAKGELKPNKT